MVISKNCFFFLVAILAYIGHENVFYDVLERRNAFLRLSKEKVN